MRAKTLALFVPLVAAGPALAQAPASSPSEAQSSERPATRNLNLKLEEPARSQPRIQFGPRDAAGQEAVNSLPELGANRSRSFDPVPGSKSTSAPYPEDMKHPH